MANNAAAHATLQGWIRDLKAMPDMVKQAPAALVPVVQAECDQAIAEGRSLDGYQWSLTIKDGKRALQTVKVAVSASGNIIWMKIKGGAVFAQFGTHREKRRPIFPTSGMPVKLGNAIRLGLIDMAPDFLKRGGSHHKLTKGVKWTPTMGGA